MQPALTLLAVLRPCASSCQLCCRCLCGMRLLKRRTATVQGRAAGQNTRWRGGSRQPADNCRCHCAALPQQRVCSGARRGRRRSCAAIAAHGDWQAAAASQPCVSIQEHAGVGQRVHAQHLAAKAAGAAGQRVKAGSFLQSSRMCKGRCQPWVRIALGAAVAPRQQPLRGGFGCHASAAARRACRNAEASASRTCCHTCPSAGHVCCHACPSASHLRCCTYASAGRPRCNASASAGSTRRHACHHHAATSRHERSAGTSGQQARPQGILHRQGASDAGLGWATEGKWSSSSTTEHHQPCG